MTTRTPGGRRPGAPLRMPAVAAILRRRAADPHLLYTATLVPVVLLVAVLANRPGELPLALAVSAGAVGLQAGLSLVDPSPGRTLPWRLLRLSVPVAYVAIAVETIGGPALPLLALFAPVVAGAAAIGLAEGWTIAGIAALFYVLPNLGELGSAAAVELRGLTLAGVAVLLAFGVRRIVRALEMAARDARMATIAERRRARQIHALDEVSHLLASAGPTAEQLGDLLRFVARRFGYPHLSIYLGDESGVSLVAQHGYPEALPSFGNGTGIAGRVLRTKEIAFVPDIGLEPEYVPGTIAATSLVCAPLLVDGALLGVVNVETSGGRRLDETDRNLVRIVAGRIAAAVALGRDRLALADRANLFRDIEQFGRDVSGSLALDSLAEVIVDAVGRVVAADTLAVTLLDRESGRYHVRAVRGVPDDAVGREIMPGEGLAGRAIRTRALVIDDSLTVEKHPASVRHLELPKLTHGIGVPLIRDAVVVGALTIVRTDERAAFSELEVEGVQLLSRHAALAVANAFLHADVGELAIRDPLTGLYNRRHFDEALDRLLVGHRRDRLSGWRPISAIVFDLDRFGAFNKEHGHQVGDTVLRAFAEVLTARFRASDLVARLGGEEFVAVLDGADLEAATAVADEVRIELARRTVAAEDGTALHVTVSAGCAELDRDDPSREALLRTADVALFMAKRAGRDRVVAA